MIVGYLPYKLMTLVGSLESYKVPQVLLDMIHELGIIPVYSLV